MPDKPFVLDSFWVGGCNSLIDPSFLPKSTYQWGINVDSSGGYIQTRQGYAKMPGLVSVEDDPKLPRGMTIFTPKGKLPSIILARGDQLLISQYPFKDDFAQLPGIEWRNTFGPVTFTTVIDSADIQDDGTLKLHDPVPYLIIQDGEGRAAIWDGTALVESDPSPDSNGIPIGLWSIWSGNRLWVSQGSKLYASNLSDPMTFTGDNISSANGFFVLPTEVTGIGQTPDFRNLLVFTDSTTTSFQSNILDRTQWASTTDFQKLLFPGIGCAAGKSVINQYGMTWWYSHGGLVGMDQAINTYRYSKFFFSDQQMQRSKGNLAKDISGICCGAWANYLAVSVPSGDSGNAHTWILNQSPLSSNPQTPAEWMGAWTGTRPVEWVTGVIEGENRCFFFSKDYGVGEQTFGGEIKYYTNIWEAFIGDRSDINNTFSKSIQCSFETRSLASDDKFKKIEYVELDLAEMVGNVSIQVYYSGRRGGYKQILDKEIISTPGSVNGPESVTATTTTTNDFIFLPPGSVGPFPGDTDIVHVVSTSGFDADGFIELAGRTAEYSGKTSTTLPLVSPTSYNTVTVPSGSQVLQKKIIYDPDGDDSTILSSYVPQRRTIRTTEVGVDTDCQSCGVESLKTDNIDRSFSVLVKWTGKMAITGIRLVYSVPTDSQVGACEADESSARYITEEGCGAIVSTVQQSDIYALENQHSKQVQVITPRHTEDFYTSFIANNG